MKQILTLAFVAMTAWVSAQTAPVTWEVNMANEEVSPEGVYLAGGDYFGTPGTNAMSDDDGDGIWTITLDMPIGYSGAYTFTNGACPSWSCKENIVGQDCAYGQWSDRFLPEVMEGGATYSTCFAQCTTDGTCNSVSSSEVTFRVDMSEQVIGDGVYLHAAFDGWGAIAMTDDNGDQIYEHTVTLESGVYQYLFQNGSGNNEAFDSTYVACTLTSGEFTNRILEVPEGGGAVIMDAFCYNSCDACEGSGGDAYSVTFQVDMAEYTGTYAMVNLNSSFNAWCGECAVMTDDDGDGVYTLTVDSLPAGVYEYKFTLDGWTAQEEFTEGDACTSTIDGFTNRTVTVTGDTTMPVVCYDSCEACGGGTSDMAAVTFRVDMNEQEILGPIYVSGNTIDGWCGTCVEMMDDDGDGIYEVTVELEPGAHEYKYNNASWDDSESLDPEEDADCTLTTGEFTNRYLEFSGTDPVDLAAVCFNACTACTPDFVAETQTAAFEARVTAGGEIAIQMEAIAASGVLRITSLTGALVGEWIIPQGASTFTAAPGIESNGIYLLSLTRLGQRTVQKMALTH